MDGCASRAPLPSTDTPASALRNVRRAARPQRIWTRIRATGPPRRPGVGRARVDLDRPGPERRREREQTGACRCAGSRIGPRSGPRRRSCARCRRVRRSAGRRPRRAPLSEKPQTSNGARSVCGLPLEARNRAPAGRVTVKLRVRRTGSVGRLEMIDVLGHARRRGRRGPAGREGAGGVGRALAEVDAVDGDVELTARRRTQPRSR